MSLQTNNLVDLSANFVSLSSGSFFVLPENYSTPQIIPDTVDKNILSIDNYIKNFLSNIFNSNSYEIIEFATEQVQSHLVKNKTTVRKCLARDKTGVIHCFVFDVGPIFILHS